jgi:tetratricopeptide (TPR) repeat protein
MNRESADIAQEKFDQAQQELGRNNVLDALACLEIATRLRNNPAWYSRLGFCIAKQRGHLSRALELCHAAIEHDPENPIHYLYLGKVHLEAGNRSGALHYFRQGLILGGSPELERMLDTFSARKSPVLPFFSRDNPLNKFLGIIRERFGVRGDVELEKVFSLAIYRKEHESRSEIDPRPEQQQPLRGYPAT